MLLNFKNLNLVKLITQNKIKKKKIIRKILILKLHKQELNLIMKKVLNKYKKNKNNTDNKITKIKRLNLENLCFKLEKENENHKFKISY